MKWSPILHSIATLSGVFGLLALLGAWIAGTRGTYLSFEEHLYNDATILLLVSIAFGIGTLIHQSPERQ